MESLRWAPAGKSRWMVGHKFLTGLWMGDPDRILVGKFEPSPAGIIRRNFCLKFGMAPGRGDQKVFWLKNVKVKHSVK